MFVDFYVILILSMHLPSEGYGEKRKAKVDLPLPSSPEAVWLRRSRELKSSLPCSLDSGRLKIILTYSLDSGSSRVAFPAARLVGSRVACNAAWTQVSSKVGSPAVWTPEDSRVVTLAV
jgi:hypothetical protein